MFGKNNPKFRNRAIILIILGICCYYLFCVITGEQVNLLTTTLIEETGWTVTTITSTLTYGSLMAVVMIFVINTVFMKLNSKFLMVLTTFVVAAGIAIMGLSSVTLSFATFIIAFFIIRVVIVILQHGTNLMCTNWWSKHRGKALGLVTMGAPIASASFVALTTIGSNMGMRFSDIYYVFAVIIAIIGVLMLLFFKSTPEECGLYPDGADCEPASMQVEENQSTLTIKEILTRRDSWLVIVSFGILYFGITCITAYFATVMIMKDVPSTIYLPALTIGAVIGFPASFLLGVIDDKWGTPVASMVMGCLYIVGFLGMAFSNGSTIGLIMLATIGYAAITGGCPNLNPSINTYIFGRKNYLSASRIIMALQGVIAAFANMYMGAFINAGNPTGAYLVLCLFVVLAIILLAILSRKPAYDSEEAVKMRAAAGKE